MNDSNFENIIKAYRKVRMTPQEKREVFKQSMLVIEKIEAVSLAHTDSKHLHTLLDEEGIARAEPIHKKPLSGSWIAYIRRRQFIPALVASFVLLFFGTTSMLAEEALPGDSLYSFKVGINESVRDLTAITDEAKAKLAVEMTSRRLQEAAVLSAQGKLDEKSKKILQSQFEKNVDEVKNRVASLVSNNNLNAAQEVVVDFESALQTHELILASLSGVQQTDQPSGDASAVATLAAVPADAPAVATFAAAPNPEQATPAAAKMSAMTTTASPAQHLSQPVSILLATVQSELDTAKNTRINIQEKVQANLLASQSSTTLPITQQPVPQLVIESNVKDIRLIIQDIQTEITSYTFNQSSIDFATKRLAEATSTVEVIQTLVRSGKFTEATTEIRKVQKSLAEVETLLKLDKNSRGALGETVDFAAIISASTASTGSQATTTASTTPPSSTPVTP